MLCQRLAKNAPPLFSDPLSSSHRAHLVDTVRLRGRGVYPTLLFSDLQPTAYGLEPARPAPVRPNFGCDHEAALWP